eukprot:scaffold2161_cov244-Pinguiococcus_pyrenoidosus.AAC.22
MTVSILRPELEASVANWLELGDCIGQWHAGRRQLISLAAEYPVICFRAEQREAGLIQDYANAEVVTLEGVLDPSSLPRWLFRCNLRRNLRYHLRCHVQGCSNVGSLQT